ncbi:MAG TPA: aldehyde dehydrogenase family protein [Candidatus Kryptobacter bacterium]|nr:aldehyde dehydrogenase family protein [Candidatus Kryptobacter bacterium]
MKYKLFVGGGWIETKDLAAVINPYDGTVVGEVCQAGEGEVERAIDAAVKAFEVTRELPSYKRAAILERTASQLSARKEEIARIITLESGKPIQYSRAEVDRAGLTFSIAAEEAKRIPGEFVSLDLAAGSEKRWGVVRRFPVGPVASITPFNFPLNLVAHKIGPALAAGNTVVHKSPPQTPITSAILAEILMKSGVPEGAVNVISCGNEVAEKLVTDPRLKILSFTGSPRVGWYLKSKVPKKKVILELGGNAAVIVERDADLGSVAKRLSAGAFSNAGQVCISVQRVYVHVDVYEKFRGLLVGEAKRVKAGNPLDEDTVVGPMINKAEADRAFTWIEEAKKAGAVILTGGRREGNMIQPTVLENVSADVNLYCEEAFAPVVILETYSDFDEAIRKVNDTRFGLQAGVFTNDAGKIFKAFDEIQVGGVIINDYPTFRIDNMPYGGIKDSGFGREGVRYAIEEMTEPKLLALNLQ